MSDRLTRQQLKEDPLMKTTGETVDYVQHHLKLIVGAFVGVLLVIIVVLVVRNNSAAADDRAAGILTDARGDLARGALEPAAARLTTVIQDHGGTSAAKEAHLIYAHVKYQQEQFAEAEESYREAVEAFKNDPIIGQVARRGLAATLENLTRYEEAVAVYESLVAETSPGDLRVEFQLALARNYLKTGQADKAATIYEALASDTAYPIAAQAAKQRLAEMNPTGSISG